MKPIIKTLITWLVTNLLGILFLFFLVILTEGDLGNISTEVILLIGMACLVGLAASLPGMVIFHFASVGLAKVIKQKWALKLLQCLCAAFITFSTLYTVLVLLTGGALSGKNDNGLVAQVFLAYALPFMGCALIFDYSVANNEQPQTTHPDAAPTEPAMRPTVLLAIITAVSCFQLVRLIMTHYPLISAYFTMQTAHPSVLSSLILSSPVAVIIPAGLILLWRGQKTGWVLLAFLAIWGLTCVPFSVFGLLRGFRSYGQGYLGYVLTLVLDVVQVILLFQRPVQSYARVDANARTAAIVLGVAVGITISVYYMFLTRYF